MGWLRYQHVHQLPSRLGHVVINCPGLLLVPCPEKPCVPFRLPAPSASTWPFRLVSEKSVFPFSLDLILRITCARLLRTAHSSPASKAQCDQTVLLWSLLPAGTNAAGTVVGILLVDRMGRR
jgi:hypothetical protein